MGSLGVPEGLGRNSVAFKQRIAGLVVAMMGIDNGGAGGALGDG